MRKKKHGVSVAEAGMQLGIPPSAVRILMQRGKLPIGIAEKMSGTRYSYYISQQLLDRYLGHEQPTKPVPVEGDKLSTTE